MPTDIEQLAIDYIRARRKTLDTKERRARWFAKCERLKIKDDGFSPAVDPCWKADPLEEYNEFCDACFKGHTITDKFQRLSIKSGALLRRLEHAVNKAVGTDAD